MNISLFTDALMFKVKSEYSETQIFIAFLDFSINFG